MTIEIIDRIEQVTPAWLTRALAEAGFVVEVSDVGVTPVGTGQMGASYRLEIGVVGDRGSLPETLVVKLPGADPSDRATVSPAYRAEVTFYRDVAHTVAVRAPHCHLALLSDDATEFTLLMEDLAPALQGDQIEGTDPLRVAVAARNLAGLHGPRWCDPMILTESWCSELDEGGAYFVGEVLKGAIPPLCERLGEQITAEDGDTLEAAAGVMPAFLTRARDRFAPLHGDYRLDNLMFAPDGSTVAAVDWQTLSCGLPGRDVAYLIATSLSAEDRRVHERDLVEAHRESLGDHGVSGYDHDLAFEDYRVGLLQCPLVIILGAAFSTRTERGDAMFAAMIRRSSAAIRDLDTIGLLTSS
jgi:hypothetical protein